VINIFFPDLTGGSSVFFLAAYSYIADVSEVKSRTRRFAYLDGLFPLGFYTANALAGPIKANLGLMYNFALGMLCAIICFAYCLLFVKESKVTRDKILEKEKAEMIESSVEKEGNILKMFMSTHLNSTYIDVR
jgi:MFS family permease